MQPFIRDRLTWLAYIMLAYIGFNQAMLGPLMPSLRSELGLSYTQGGFLPASLAIGLIVSGLISDRLARLWGRRVVFWSGGVGLATGVVLLALSRRFESLLVAALCIGLSI
jgi:predicted MFS family arabinose efflux permease